MPAGASETPTVLDLNGLAEAKRVRRGKPGQVVVAAVILVLAAMGVHACLTDKRFQWQVVGNYFFSSEILKGLGTTIWLTVTAMLIGCVLGLGLALMRLSSSRLLSGPASVYIWCFRGVPALVQIILWFNLAALFPRLSLGIPFGPAFVSGSANQFITPLIAANLGLGLNEAAYMAEIVRAGILGVDYGQTEASSSLGLSRWQTLRYVILPQALRMIIPPAGNEVIGMLKYTSLASVVAVTELLESAELIYQRNFQTIPLLICASIWYLIVTIIFTVGQRLVERRLGRSIRRKSANGLGRDIFRNLTSRRVVVNGAR